jgi:concanavalin A-like lectin/glucanase superfamily protein
MLPRKTRVALIVCAVAGTCLVSAASAQPAAACPGSADAYSSAVLADSPIAYYRLNEAAGTTLCDSSSSAADGTYNASGITYGVPGALLANADAAVTANGTSGVIGTGGPSGITGNASFTLEGWYRNTVATQNQVLVGIGTGSASHAAGLATWANVGSCTSTASGLALDVFGDSNCWDTGPAGVNVFDGQWHHLAITYTAGSPGSAVGYVDGRGLGAQARAALNLGASSVLVGNWVDTFVNQPYKGSADEVAVYGSALPAASILAHDQAAIFPSTITPATGKQKLKRKIGVVVSCGVDACLAEVDGVLRVVLSGGKVLAAPAKVKKFKLPHTSAQLAPNTTTTVKVRVPKKVFKKAKAAKAAGGKLTAAFTVKLTSGAHQKTAQSTIKLK